MSNESRVFISYSRTDVVSIHKLRDDLKKQGYIPCVDEILRGKVGSSLPVELSSLIDSCNFMIVWITKEALDSGWVEMEYSIVLDREARLRKTFLLPCLVEDVEIPVSLRHKIYADFREDYGNGLEEVLSSLKNYTYDDTQLTDTVRQYYEWYFNLNGFQIPYIPLIVNLKKIPELFPRHKFIFSTESKSIEIPKEFKQSDSYQNKKHDPHIENLASCSLSYYSEEQEDKFSYQFAQTKYVDYLVCEEHLDDYLPNNPNTTYRDEFGKLIIDGTKSLRPFKLSNICGVGVFIVTKDGSIVLTRHSNHSNVYPKRVTYSASGTLKWGVFPDPFASVMIKSFQEINHQINSDNLYIIDVGVDARKLYFQFSFVEYTDATLKEIEELKPDGIELFDFKFDLSVLIKNIVGDVNTCWEPAAQAALLSLTLIKFGYRDVFEELAKYKDIWYQHIMLDEWANRALREELLSVMSNRYPKDQLFDISNDYINSVVKFIGQEINDKDVLEIGSGTGRLTAKLAQKAKSIIGIDCSSAMVELAERLKKKNSRLKASVEFRTEFAQNIQARKHDVVICSLVLIHNVEEKAFKDLVETMTNCANTVMVFEDVSQNRKTSPYTRLRSKKQLVPQFGHFGFNLVRESSYNLAGDTIAFLKFEKHIN